MPRILAIASLGLIIIVTLILLPFQFLFVRFFLPGAKKLPTLYHRIVCWLLGVRVIVKGRPLIGQPCLLVGNHISWLDIPAMISLGQVSFVARGDMIEWPIFGLLARLQRTLFVDRTKRSSTRDFKEHMYSRVTSGDSIILFPEGTSSDGSNVLPFKSALFSAVERDANTQKAKHKDIPVQPFSIAYTKSCGIPMGRSIRPLFSWIGDMDIFPSIWRVALMGSCEIEVTFFEPKTAHEMGGRKELSLYCEDLVRQGLVASNQRLDTRHLPIK